MATMSAGRTRTPPIGEPVTTERVERNLALARARIEAAGGDIEAVTVVAVTKGFGPDAVEAARSAGLGDIGENYAQELLAKASTVTDGLRWHFIGAIQRNKVRSLSRYVALWQTIERVAVGEAVAGCQPGAAVMVQVNISGEETKHGCREDEVPALVAQLRELGLDVRGLMAVGPTGDPELSRPGFRRLATMAGDLGLDELSMGMTADLEVAVQEGATMVRLGRALFGARPGVNAVPR